MRSILRAAAFTSIAAALCALGGCKSGYGVDLRNETNAPVVATMTASNWAGTETLEQRQLGPGDRRSMGPHALGETKTVVLTVDSKDNPVAPAQMQLNKGVTPVVVRRQGGQDKGPITLDLLPPNR
jgi:hypothetical protein